MDFADDCPMIPVGRIPTFDILFAGLVIIRVTSVSDVPHLPQRLPFAATTLVTTCSTPRT